VQLRKRKNGALVPKRQEVKHLELRDAWFGTMGSEVQILSPRPFSLAVPVYLIREVTPDLRFWERERLRLRFLSFSVVFPSDRPFWRFQTRLKPILQLAEGSSLSPASI
jgi:hypothetical protein